MLVGRLVSTGVGDTGVEVSVQAKELRIAKSKKNGFRLISEIFSPVRILYPNEKEDNSFYEQIKIPVLNGDMSWIFPGRRIRVFPCRLCGAGSLPRQPVPSGA